jgi:hypothetical protein
MITIEDIDIKIIRVSENNFEFKIGDLLLVKNLYKDVFIGDSFTLTIPNILILREKDGYSRFARLEEQ